MEQALSNPQLRQRGRASIEFMVQVLLASGQTREAVARNAEAMQRKLGFKHAAIATASAACLSLAGCVTPGEAPPLGAQPALCADLLTGDASVSELSLTRADGRVVPTTLVYPDKPGTYPLIAFSHGAFAAPDRYFKMLKPLAAAGYVVIAPMHIDSEEMGREVRPGEQELWSTRNQDMQMALEPSAAVVELLTANGIALSDGGKVAMGHSFGSAMAHFAGGVRSAPAKGDLNARAVADVDAVVLWSPPGALEGTVDQASWADIDAPSLTFTGTTDTLPGFVDDWQLRKIPFEQAPQGSASLWVGENIDHYFGGMFGREKPAGEQTELLFGRALAQTLGFLHRAEIYSAGLEHVGDLIAPCRPGPAIAGESFETR